MNNKELRGRRAEATLGMFSRKDIYPETKRKKKGDMWWAGAKKLEDEWNKMC